MRGDFPIGPNAIPHGVLNGTQHANQSDPSLSDNDFETIINSDDAQGSFSAPPTSTTSAASTSDWTTGAIVSGLNCLNNACQ